MKISWLGHSSFLITVGKTRIVTDPYDNSVGYRMPEVTADIVTCSHAHGDHSCVSKVSGNPTVINALGEHEAGGIKLRGIQSFHDDKGGRLRGNNIIYLFEFGKVTVCHMGDIGEECSETLLNKLPEINILLVPVGGYYTINAKQAKRYADRIKPNIVVPMHYKTADCVYPISGVDEFTALFDKEVVQSVNDIELDENADMGKFKVYIPAICK